MTSAFDRATAVSHRGGGLYDAHIDGAWGTGNKPNGGYLMAVAVAAMGAAVPQPDPLTVTGHFLRPAAPGPAAVEVHVLRAGRAHATAEAVLSQPDPRRGHTDRLRVLATFGDLAEVAEPALLSDEPPPMPPPQDCLLAPEHLPNGRHIGLHARFEARYDPATVRWLTGEPNGVPEHRAWMRLADGREPDATVVLHVVDALAPTTFNLGLTGWVPTVELTCHLLRRPAGGWLRVVTTCRAAVGAYLEEEAAVWDGEDRLVARARQLALVPRDG